MEYLVSDGRTQVDALEKRVDSTPSDFTIRSRNYKAVRILLEAKASPNCKYRSRWNLATCPLYLVVNLGDVDLVKVLLGVKANPNGSESGRPLLLAIRRGEHEIVEVALLSVGADPSGKPTLRGSTALHVAASSLPDFNFEDMYYASPS